MKKALICSVLAMLGASLLPIGTAQAADPVRSMVVRHHDLDLGSERGRRSLDLRILHAASELCGTPSALDRRGAADARDCRVQVTADARSQVATALARRSGGGVEVAAAR